MLLYAGLDCWPAALVPMTLGNSQGWQDFVRQLRSISVSLKRALTQH